MIEFLRHILGFCGEHFHPNVWTVMAGSPLIASTVYYIKCKCGGLFNHTKSCKHDKNTKK